MNSEKLVFLISLPRSGSTLLQAILSNHDAIDTVSEHWLQLPFLSIYKPELIKAEYKYDICVDALFDYQKKTKSESKFKNQLKDFLLSQYDHIQTKTNNFVLDKTPRYYEILNELIDIYPNAKFIILKRNPILAFKSMMDTWYKHDVNGISESFNRDIFYAPYLIQDFLDRHHHKENVTVVNYESLVEKPEKTLQALFSFLDLKFQGEFLNYNSNDSFRGKYGDQSGINKSTTLVKKEISLNEEIKQIQKHQNKGLLLGYGNYLGKEFLTKYGYEYPKQYKKTPHFYLLESISKGYKNNLTQTLLKLYIKLIHKVSSIIK